MLTRLFFINWDRTKYVSVGFYPARDYLPLVGFGTIRRGVSKSVLLTDEHIGTLADCLPKMLVSIYNGWTGAAAVGCESGAFRLSDYHRRRTTGRQDYISQYVILTILDLE